MGVLSGEGEKWGNRYGVEEGKGFERQSFGQARRGDSNADEGTEGGGRAVLY